MPSPEHRPARLALAWPALLATVLLLIVLLGAYTLIESRRLQRELSRELEDRAVALIDILEASSKNAIASNSLLEEAVAQRLLDNARFIDFFVARSPRAQELIQRVVTENRLAKAELLDPEGQPIPPPRVEASPGPGRRGPGAPEVPGQPQGFPSPGQHPRMMMGWMTGPPAGSEPPSPEDRRMPGLPFMWGHRWGAGRGDPASVFPSLPTNAKIRRFWEGSAFGVAIPAQSFTGIIAVHADAEYLLNFRREIGVQRLIEDLGRQSGVVGVALLDRDLAVLASSDAAAVGRREDDPFLRETWQTGTVKGRRRSLADGREVYEVAKPFALEAKRVGLVRLDLSTEGLAGVSRQAQRGILSYSLGLLFVGIAGAVAIFWIQARHLAERRALEAAVAREQRLSAVGNLAAGVAHEIRNPLNAISIGLQRLRKEFAPSELEGRDEYLRFTEIMHAEVGRLNTIVDRFLTLAGPARLTLTVEPLVGVLEELLALLSSQAAAQKIRVVTDLALGEAKVRMDRQQLTHAFMNVVLNAIQAMPDGGTLTVHGKSISNFGFRISDSAIRNRHGSIRVESGVGSGANFVVTLPIVETT